MSQELNDFIDDLDVFVFQLNNGQVGVSEVIDVEDKKVSLNYPLSIKGIKSFEPYGTAIKQVLPLTSVNKYFEAGIDVKSEYFKYNLVRKIVSIAGLSEQELFEFKLILDEEPPHFVIEEKFEKDLSGFWRGQKMELN
jgi:hypothetical protein